MQPLTFLILLALLLVLGGILYWQHQRLVRKGREAESDSLSNDVREFVHELNNSLLVAMSNMEMLADSLEQNAEQRTLAAHSLEACKEISEMTGRFSAQFRKKED